MKREKSRRISKRRKHTTILLLLFLSLIGFMVFYIWIFNHSNMMFKKIEELQRKEANLLTQNRIASVELDKLSRSDRIIKIASVQLDMVIPAPETLVVIIDPNSIKIN